VYCGSRLGSDAAFADAARALGGELARRGHSLVYGGGRVGLMGVVADAALAAGAHVVGVIPQALHDREVAHHSLTELLVVSTMHERKLAMAARADAFVALPGGIGTLEELYEMWSWHQLGYHDKPLALLNTSGYFDPLLAFMRSSVAAGMVDERSSRILRVHDTVTSLLDDLEAATARRGVEPNYRAI
jgi:uncharacterized protein (TIGR00730 family)